MLVCRAAELKVQGVVSGGLFHGFNTSLQTRLRKSWRCHEERAVRCHHESVDDLCRQDPDGTRWCCRCILFMHQFDFVAGSNLTPTMILPEGAPAWRVKITLLFHPMMLVSVLAPDSKRGLVSHSTYQLALLIWRIGLAAIVNIIIVSPFCHWHYSRLISPGMLKWQRVRLGNNIGGLAPSWRQTLWEILWNVMA